MHAPLRTLASLGDGDVAAVSALAAGPLAERLHAMGFDEGVRVQVLHRAPFGGDPLAVRVGAMTVALSRSLAELVHIDPA
jgi:ferrous iron transport protein A